ADPARCVDIHDVGEVDDLHRIGPADRMERGLIDHKTPRSARWPPSSNRPTKNHTRNVSSLILPRVSCPSHIPTSAAASAAIEGPATDVPKCPVSASAAASVTVETVNDSPNACTSLSRSKDSA